jgi:hypothetical protein
MSDNGALSVYLFSSAIFCSNLCCVTMSIDAIVPAIRFISGLLIRTPGRLLGAY